MPILSIVLWFLMNAPELISLLRSILDILRKFPKDQQHSFLEEIRHAMEIAKMTGDKSLLEQVLRRHQPGIVSSPSDVIKD